MARSAQSESVVFLSRGGTGSIFLNLRCVSCSATIASTGRWSLISSISSGGRFIRDIAAYNVVENWSTKLDVWFSPLRRKYLGRVKLHRSVNYIIVCDQPRVAHLYRALLPNRSSGIDDSQVGNIWPFHSSSD
jgi:hypothetical protein